MAWAYLAAALALLCAGCTDARMRFDGDVRVLEGVTVIDGTGRQPLPDQTVVVRHGRIVAVGDAGTFAFGDSAEVINLAGRYLLPGFIDMHAHVTGKHADLVVLTANPLQNIRNTRAIEWVMHGGVLHKPDSLLAEP